MWVNGRLVVNNDGLHGTRWRSGRIYLRQGSANIKVVTFERGGGATLYVDWAGPGFSRQRMTWRRAGRLVSELLEGKKTILKDQKKKIVVNNQKKWDWKKALGELLQVRPLEELQ